MNNAICNRNIRILNIYTICINALMLLPILLPYYRDYLGLSFHEFLMIESVFAFMIVILDVPTGWLADNWGRKNTLILGAFTFALGIFMIAQASGFWTAALAEVILGAGTSLMNGANSAMLYDSLLLADRQSEYRKREGFRFALQLYSCAAASVVGGYLYTVSPTLPALLQVGIILGAAILGFWFIEPPRHKKTVEGHPVKDILRTIRYITHGHKEIAGLVLLMMLIFSTTKICMWSIQIYLKELGVAESWNGWTISALMLAGGLCGHLGHKIWPSLYGRHALYALGSLLTLSLIGAGVGISWLGLASLSIEAFVFGVGMPRAQEAINNLAESGMRATILSSASLATSLGFIPMSQLIGWMTDHYGIGSGLLAHAGLIATLGLFAYWLVERNAKHGYATAISTTTGT